MYHTSRTSVVGLLLSGGLDSAILSACLAKEGNVVQPFYVRSQLAWEKEELAAVGLFIEALGEERIRPVIFLDVPSVDLYEGHWSVTGRDVPDHATPDEAVYLPGRNMLLLLKVGLWCHLHEVERIALATLAGNPFADASDSFIQQFQEVLNQAVGGSLRIERPFRRLHKQQVMALAEGLPLEHTFSCIAPAAGVHCGQCNKCAERQTAFREAGRMDPTRYFTLRSRLTRHHNSQGVVS